MRTWLGLTGRGEAPESTSAAVRFLFVAYSLFCIIIISGWVWVHDAVTPIHAAPGSRVPACEAGV